MQAKNPSLALFAGLAAMYLSAGAAGLGIAARLSSPARAGTDTNPGPAIQPTQLAPAPAAASPDMKFRIVEACLLSRSVASGSLPDMQSGNGYESLAVVSGRAGENTVFIYHPATGEITRRDGNAEEKIDALTHEDFVTLQTLRHCVAQGGGYIVPLPPIMPVFTADEAPEVSDNKPSYIEACLFTRSVATGFYASVTIYKRDRVYSAASNRAGDDTVFAYHEASRKITRRDGAVEEPVGSPSPGEPAALKALRVCVARPR